jgi:hypothetical protein
VESPRLPIFFSVPQNLSRIFIVSFIIFQSSYFHHRVAEITEEIFFMTFPDPAVPRGTGTPKVIKFQPCGRY